jgi:hypothetical protein
MLRFSLLAIVLLLTSAAHGQVLQSAHNFQVYEEEFSFFNANTMHPQGMSSHRVNYLLTCYVDNTGALQVRRHNTSDTSPLTASGGLVCQLSGIDYLRHEYENEVLERRDVPCALQDLPWGNPTARVCDTCPKRGRGQMGSPLW